MRKLEVRLAFTPGERRLVGHLAEAERRIYFEYDAAFLRDPLWLSPFKLPPEPGLHEHRDRAFGPLFGLFDDSLPDGWGLLLMDCHFRRRGVDPEAVSPLDRLAYLGERTMGALTYHPPAHEEAPDHQLLRLHELSCEACSVLEGKSDRVLPQLLRAGGSPGGARPKVLVGVRGEDLISGEDDLPGGYVAWMVKFHAGATASDDGRVEQAYAEMARACGVAMPATRLFETREGDAFFGVMRFDRERNRRRHVHTFGNLIHSNFRVPGCDYEVLLRVVRVLTRNQADVEQFFRLMVFNVAAHNRDDHVKNFAFLMDEQGVWRVAPAYDLTFAPGPGGEHTMTVAGEGRQPGRAHLLRLAQGAGLSPGDAIRMMGEVKDVVAEWPKFARASGVGRGRMQHIHKAIQSCLKGI